jgi:hypothetical protein
MGKCSNAFFSETTNIIKAKLYINVHKSYRTTDGGRQVMAKALIAFGKVS